MFNPVIFQQAEKVYKFLHIKKINEIKQITLLAFSFLVSVLSQV